MSGLIARTSTIFIATSERTDVYRSLAEVPLPLRRKLQASTRGMNSATILIADKRGREELVRALKGEPSETWSLLSNVRARKKPQAPPVHWLPRTWLELVFPVLVGASLWLLMSRY